MRLWQALVRIALDSHVSVYLWNTRLFYCTLFGKQRIRSPSRTYHVLLEKRLKCRKGEAPGVVGTVSYYPPWMSLLHRLVIKVID